MCAHVCACGSLGYIQGMADVMGALGPAGSVDEVSGTRHGHGGKEMDVALRKRR